MIAIVIPRLDVALAHQALVLFGDPHKGIGAALGGPVEGIAVIGKFIAAEGGPVAMVKPAPERMGDGGNGGPGDGREPERPDEVRAHFENKQRRCCDCSGRKATEHEGALAPRRLAWVSVRVRSRHGCNLSVYSLWSELRSGLSQHAGSCAGPGSAHAGPPPAPFSAGLCLARVSVRMRSRQGCDLFVYGLCSELRSGLRHRARSGAGLGVRTGSAPAGPARGPPHYPPGSGSWRHRSLIAPRFPPAAR